MGPLSDCSEAMMRRMVSVFPLDVGLRWGRVERFWTIFNLILPLPFFYQRTNKIFGAAGDSLTLRNGGAVDALDDPITRTVQ